MQLKILSWNIWFDGYFDEIASFLAKSKADIIALQEVVPEDTTRDVIGYLTKLGYQYTCAPTLTVKKDGRKFGNAIFSRYNILNSNTTILPGEGNRNVLSADIKAEETIFHIITTHLMHTHQQPSETQKLQAEELIAILPLDRTIVTGDFNAAPKSEAMQAMEKVLVNADPASVPTWSVYPEGCSTCRLSSVSIKLDYIFITKDIKASSFRVENSKGSDHLPISAIIEV